MAAFIWVDVEGLRTVAHGTSLPNSIGQKARGIATLPDEWVPPFIVISSDIATTAALPSGQERNSRLQPWLTTIATALERAGLAGQTDLIVRSNALEEAIEDRGTYISKESTRHELADRICEVVSESLRRNPDGKIGLIIQSRVPAVFRGHLSNARRVSRELRDALLELENCATGEVSEQRLAHRSWRQSTPFRAQPLTATTVSQLVAAMRDPLALSVRNRKRVLYEWVWDGNRIYIVQADHAEDPTGGTNPNTVVHSRTAALPSENLRAFSVATDENAKNSQKLANHLAYKAQGFWQPTFYLLRDLGVLRSILRGAPTTALTNDLKLLTKSPLIIRTSEASNRFQMLPRSDLLTSTEQAHNWLTGPLTSGITGIGIDAENVSLIAHHFIPALGAAFSSGSPTDQLVSVEALWGIPEGLYYFPCDSYVVHTRVADARVLNQTDQARFVVQRHVTFKPYFVAPSPTGIFERYNTATPWDWSPAIKDDNLLRQMAFFTRKLAIESNAQLSLMWFLGCRTADGDFPAIPWYHEPLKNQTTSLQYHRNKNDDFRVVSTVQDVESLETMARSALARPRRLVLELRPTEDVAIRDDKFVRRIGEAATALNATVLLNGASLSHVYYILCRAGANVVTRKVPDTLIKESHSKLVRDRIPDVVAQSGEIARVAPLSPTDKVKALKMKLVEEAFEARDASSNDHLIGELADVAEVVKAILDASGISAEEVEAARIQKAEKRGGFEQGILLIETVTESQSNIDGEVTAALLEYPPDQSPKVESARSLPSVDDSFKEGWRDIRSGAAFKEFVQSANITLTHPRWRITSPKDSVHSLQGEPVHVDWILEGKRKGGTLRIRLKVRIGSGQLELPLRPDRTKR